MGRMHETPSPRLFVVGPQGSAPAQSQSASGTMNTPDIHNLLESLPEGVLLSDHSGAISLFNRKLIDLWNIPESLLADGNVFDILNQLVGDLPAADWVRRTKDHRFEGQGVLKLKNGGFCEIHSAAISPKELPGGRLWRFRDVTEWNPAIREKAARLQLLEMGIRRGLEQNEFRVHYQPILSAKTGRAEAFEALVRWYHPERGIVPPSEFIPVAEETGLIVPLGEMVLREAAQQLRKWQLKFNRRLGMSVNISARQLENNDLNQVVRSVLEETEIPPCCLMLEITEGALIKDVPAAMDLMTRLKGQNVRLLLDDFGTGHSSLNYLNLFPFDTLKIDRSFVDGMTYSTEKAKILKAIVTLARNLHMDVIAEGVETEEQAVTLKALRCRWLQGFVYGHPEPASEVETRLQQRKL